MSKTEDFTLIEVKDLKKSIRGTAVANGISQKFNNGKAYGILDLNAASRASFLALLAGASLPDGGCVRVNGFDTKKEGARVSQCVGYLSAALNPYPDMTPEEYLTFVASAKGLDPDTSLQKVQELLDDAELRGRKRSLCIHLSKAEVRRLGLAQAMLGDPEILVVSDPTAGLEGREAQDMLDRLYTLAETKTLFVGSGSLTTLRECCSVIVVLSDGDILGTFMQNDPALDDLYATLCEKNGQKNTDIPQHVRGKRRFLRRQAAPKKSDENQTESEDLT